MEKTEFKTTKRKLKVDIDASANVDELIEVLYKNHIVLAKKRINEIESKKSN